MASSQNPNVVQRLSWPELCQSDEFAGRWVALDQVRYDPATSEPLEGEIVDVDDDLAELCGRLRARNRSSCRILHCDPSAYRMPESVRPSSPPPAWH
jgi:hypothetical protein